MTSNELVHTATCTLVVVAVMVMLYICGGSGSMWWWCFMCGSRVTACSYVCMVGCARGCCVGE